MRFERSGPIALLAVSAEGAELAAGLLDRLQRATLWVPRESLHARASAYEGTLSEQVARVWPEAAALVFVMASGIAVRAIAPLVTSKHADPAVVAVDDTGRFAIALLSGHEGGANALAADIAEMTGALPVVTTGSEASRRIVLGVGSRKGVSARQVLAAIDEALQDQGLARRDVRALATIDMKAGEPGIRAAAVELGVPLRVVRRDRIRAMQEALREPTFAEEVTGVAAVCVPAALMSDPHAILLSQQAKDGVTVAIAEDDCSSSASDPAPART